MLLTLNAFNPSCIDVNPFDALFQGPRDVRLHTAAEELFHFGCLLVRGELGNERVRRGGSGKLKIGEPRDNIQKKSTYR